MKDIVDSVQPKPESDKGAASTVAPETPKAPEGEKHDELPRG